MWYDMVDSEGGFDGKLDSLTAEQIQNMKQVYQTTDATQINMKGDTQWSDAAPYETPKESQQAPTASGTSPVTSTVPVVDSSRPPASGVAPVSQQDQAVATSQPASATPVTEGSDNIIPGKTAQSATTATIPTVTVTQPTTNVTNLETVSGTQAAVATSTPSSAQPISQTALPGVTATSWASDSSDQLPTSNLAAKPLS